MSKPRVQYVRVSVVPQTWRWAARSEARSVEAEYWSLTVTKTSAHEVWHWARSCEQPGPLPSACPGTDSLWEEGKTWTTISILVTPPTQRGNHSPPHLIIKILPLSYIPSLLHFPSSSPHYSLPPLHSWRPLFIIPLLVPSCFALLLLFSGKVISQGRGVAYERERQ